MLRMGYLLPAEAEFIDSLNSNPSQRIGFPSIHVRACGGSKGSSVQGSRLENGRVDVHVLGMDQILPPELSELELEALREIAVHPASHHTPFRVESRLKDIGYAKEVLGDLVLTDDGLQRVALTDDRQASQMP
jgi:hypothetical protein